MLSGIDTTQQNVQAPASAQIKTELENLGYDLSENNGNNAAANAVNGLVADLESGLYGSAKDAAGMFDAVNKSRVSGNSASIDNANVNEYTQNTIGANDVEANGNEVGRGYDGRGMQEVRRGSGNGRRVEGIRSVGVVGGQYLPADRVRISEQLNQNSPVYDESTRASVEAAGASSFDFRNANNAASTFSQALETAKVNNPNGGAVDSHSAKEIQGIIDRGGSVFITPDGTAGGAVDEGNLTAVFKDTLNNQTPHAGPAIALAGVSKGAVMGDCFGRNLVNMYSRAGFEPVGRTKYTYGIPGNEAMDAQVRQQMADGIITKEPSVYALKLRQNATFESILSAYSRPKEYTQAELDALPEYTGENGYDEMLAARDSLIAQQGIRPLNADYHTESSPYGNSTVGAAQAGETYVSRAADNTLANSELANDPAANKIIQDMRAGGKFDVQSVSEARSVRNAQNMLQTDFDAEAKRLTQDGVDFTNGGRDFDESMLLMSDRRTSPSDVRTLMQKTVQAWHNAGQALQSAAKYSRTSGTLLAKAQQSIDENGTYWATKNQKAQQQIEEIGDAWDAYLKNNSETLNSKSEIHDLLQNLIDKSALSDRLKNRIKPDSVEQLASIIASSKNTNGKALGQMFDNYFNSGLFGFSDESIQQVQDLFAEAENYNPNSKQFVDLTNQAYKVLAMQMGHSSWGQKFRAYHYWSMLSSPRSYIKNGIGNIVAGTTALGDRAAKAIIESVYNKTHKGNEIHTSAIAVPARELAAAYKDFDNNAYAPSTQTSKFENVGGVERGIMSSTPIFKNKALESIRNIPGDILNEMDVNGMGGLLTWAKNLQGGNAVSSQMKQLGIATENAITKAGEHGIIGVGGIKNNYAREASSYAKANNASFSDLVETENAARSRIENGNALTENELLAADTTTEAEKTQIELLAKARAYAISKSLETTFHNKNDLANIFSRAERTAQGHDSYRIYLSAEWHC